jgi:hypothetical protein
MVGQENKSEKKKRFRTKMRVRKRKGPEKQNY